MGYRGTQNGMEVYDYLEDVPDSLMKSGRKFIVMDPPEEVIETKGVILTPGSGLLVTLFSILKIAAYCILAVIVGHYLVHSLMQTGYAFQGRPGQKVDENLFEGGDGSVWVRDPYTGEWTMIKGPTTSVLLWAIVAIVLITAAIFLFIAYQKGWFEKKDSKPKKEISKPKKKTTTKNNPGRAPKKWWDRKYKEVKEDNPDYSDHMIRGTVGKTWYQNMSESERKEIIAQEG